MFSPQEKALQRKQDLEDSLQAQQYFADANEAESWMREKEPIAANTDYGKDEDSSEVGFNSTNVQLFLSYDNVMFVAWGDSLLKATSVYLQQMDNAKTIRVCK